MKTSISKLFLALALAAGFATSTFGAAMPGATQGEAVVKVVTGAATFTDATGGTGTIKNDLVIRAGTTINTGPGASVVLDLGDNGNALEIKPDSTLKIDTLLKKQVGSEKAIRTELDVKKGSIVGNVKKLSKASTYEVKTANGVAGIRGTSFHIYAVGIFRCANGMLFVIVMDVTPGQAPRTVTVPVPAGREVVVPPPAPQQPGQPPVSPPPLQTGLIEPSVVVAIMNNANVLAQIVQIPVGLPPSGTPPPLQQVTDTEHERVNQLVQNALNQFAQSGANFTGQQRVGNALAFEDYLKTLLPDNDPQKVAKVNAGVAAYEKATGTALAINELQAGVIGRAAFDHFVVGENVNDRINAEIRNHKDFTPAQAFNLDRITAENAFATRVAHDITGRISPTDPRLNLLIDAAAMTFTEARRQGLDQTTCYAAAKAVFDKLADHGTRLSPALVQQAIQAQKDNAVAGNQLSGIFRLVPGNLPQNLNDVPVSPIN